MLKLDKNVKMLMLYRDNDISQVIDFLSYLLDENVKALETNAPVVVPQILKYSDIEIEDIPSCKVVFYFVDINAFDYEAFISALKRERPELYIAEIQDTGIKVITPSNEEFIGFEENSDKQNVFGMVLEMAANETEPTKNALDFTKILWIDPQPNRHYKEREAIEERNLDIYIGITDVEAEKYLAAEDRYPFIIICSAKKEDDSCDFSVFEKIKPDSVMRAVYYDSNIKNNNPVTLSNGLIVDVYDRMDNLLACVDMCRNQIGGYLKSKDLRGKDFMGANLDRANLEGVDLSGAFLNSTHFSEANLNGANLIGADLRGAALGGAGLRGADLSRANLSEADLRGADLSRANLSETELRGADLSKAILNEVNLRGSDISSANYEFSGLRELHLPEGLTSIEARAFEGFSGLSGELHLPESLTSIGARAFSGCSGLSGELHLPEGLTSIGDGAFEGCSGLSGELHLPESLTSIGARAFSGCSRLSGELHLPESLTSIGDGAFSGCSGLSGELHLPESLTSIGARAFYGCDTKKVYFHNENTGIADFLTPYSNTVIVGYRYSTAETYAREHGLVFEEL